jgi:hypothetical protein
LGEGIEIPHSKNVTSLGTEQTQLYIRSFFGPMGNGHEFWHMEHEEPKLVRDTEDSGEGISNVHIKFICKYSIF